MRVPGVPFDPGAAPRGPLRPIAVILHRTIGRWPGDYSIGKYGGPQGFIGFHFLIGQASGQWVQFFDTAVMCNHAAGANGWAIGIEVSGQNGEPLTPWQIEALGHILHAIAAAHGIPLVYYDGARVTSFRGVLNHRNIATEPKWMHHNYIPEHEFRRAIGTAAAPAPAASPESNVVPLRRKDPGMFTVIYNGVPQFFWVDDDGSMKWRYRKGRLPSGALDFAVFDLLPAGYCRPHAPVGGVEAGAFGLWVAAESARAPGSMEVVEWRPAEAKWHGQAA